MQADPRTGPSADDAAEPDWLEHGPSEHGTQSDGTPEEDPHADEPPLPYAHVGDVPKPALVSAERCFELVYALGRAHPNPAEGKRFGPETGAVLWALLGRDHQLVDDGRGIRIAQAGAANACNLSVLRTRSALKRLAAFGIVQCVYASETGSGFCAIGDFYFNPLAVQLLLRRGGRKISRAAIDPFLTMGLSRDPEIRSPQGWMGFDVEYGEVEPAPGTPLGATKRLAPWARTLGDELGALEESAAAVTAVGAHKKARAVERLRRNALAESFVSGCASVWQAAHERRGFGTGRPAWEGPFESLSPENKKQFRELKALFERSGGSVVAMAWACFVNYQPFLDERGKLKFDPAMPHVQWVSSDKKPSHFAKHFDAVLLDPEVRRIAADEAVRGRVAEAIGPTFATPPAPLLSVAVAEKKGKNA